MPSLLYVEDEDDLRSLVASMLGMRCGIEVLEAPSGNRAIEILKQRPDIEIVVSDYTMADGTGGDLFKFVEKNRPATDFILCSALTIDSMPEFLGKAIAGAVMKPDVLPELTKLVQASLKKRNLAAGGMVGGYVPIEVGIIAKLNPLPCALYIELGMSRFVKVMKEGDPFNQRDRERMEIEKGLKHLYVRGKDVPELVKALARTSVNLAEVTEDLSNPDSIRRLAEMVPHKEVRDDLLSIAMMLGLAQKGKLKAEASVGTLTRVQQSVVERIHELGFSQEVQAMTKASVVLALNSMKSLDTFAAILDRFDADPDAYVASHSVYLAHVACAFASLMAWNSEATRFKLAVASFLHDAGLGSDELARMTSSEIVIAQANGIRQAELDLVLGHPLKAAEMTRSADAILGHNIDEIILNHHERPDGSGFPKQMPGAKIPAIAALFIVAHDFVDSMFEKGRAPEMIDFLTVHAGEYDVGNFRKIFDALSAKWR